jgi:putative hydrolase of the HAD superfamily
MRPPTPHVPAPRALSLDYWDTIYHGGVLSERMELRRAAIGRMFAAVGRPLPDEELASVYRAAGVQSDRWWREEHRGYTTEERIRWMLARVGVDRPDDCAHVSEAAREVDDVLLRHPPALLPGAADAVRTLAARWPLAIVSDTGFASGLAQDRLLERDGLLRFFPVRVYSCDVGHAKPHPAPFAAAARALGIAPGEIMHIGDIERTDVRGALAAGFRAARVDIARESGASEAEVVVRSWESLVDWLVRQPGP